MNELIQAKSSSHNMDILKNLFVIAVIFIVLGLTLPIILVSLFDIDYASKLGDAIGGITTPFLSVSTLMILIFTYYNQKRFETRFSERDVFFEILNKIQSEFEKIEVIQYRKTGGEAKEEIFKAKRGLKKYVEYLNDDLMDQKKILSLPEFHTYVNIYRSLNNLIDVVRASRFLPKEDLKLLFSQINLFYVNHLYIDPQERGDEICQGHNKKHELPFILYDPLIEIERKLKEAYEQ
ncbi:MAG: hypothetical protein WBO44_14350 [Saprospiraceae bacterium]